MPVHPIAGVNVVYVEIPKAGCTSMKTALSPLKGGPPEPWEDVHQWFGYTHARDHHQLREWMQRRWERYFRFTVVRHPIARFESFFDGRLRPEDNINEYVLQKLERETDIHAARQTDLLGWDLSMLDFVGRLEDVKTINDQLSLALKQRFRLPRANVGPVVDREPLSKEARRAVISHYRADFELLGYEP